MTKNLGKILAVAVFALVLVAGPLGVRKASAATTPLSNCMQNGIVFKLKNPYMQHSCVWIIQAWLNEARDKYNQEGNPAWVLLQGDSLYGPQTRDMVRLWQYIAGSALPDTGEADNNTVAHMFLKCRDAETAYGYNSALC